MPFNNAELSLCSPCLALIGEAAVISSHYHLISQIFASHCAENILVSSSNLQTSEGRKSSQKAIIKQGV